MYMETHISNVRHYETTLQLAKAELEDNGDGCRIGMN